MYDGIGENIFEGWRDVLTGSLCLGSEGCLVELCKKGWIFS